MNGELDNETTSNMNATGTGEIAIGAALGVTEFFPGRIDEVGIFNHCLTPEEVLEANRERTYAIPIFGPVRSINLSNAVSVIVYEALRQMGRA